MKKGLWIGIVVLIVAIGFAAFGVKAVPQKSGAVASADNFDTNHTIAVSGEGVIEVAPDTGYADFGISIRKKTASEAMDELSDTANRVLDVLKNFGILEKDIKTTGLSLNPVYEWNKEEKKNVLVGFDATENFSVKTKLDEIGKVITLATNNGANRIYGIRFDSSETENLRKEAIAKAVEDAREKAKAALSETNYKIVGIKTISVQSGNVTPLVRQTFDNETIGGKSSVPVEGGSITIKATVNVVFIFD